MWKSHCSTLKILQITKISSFESSNTPSKNSEILKRYYRLKPLVERSSHTAQTPEKLPKWNITTVTCFHSFLSCSEVTTTPSITGGLRSDTYWNRRNFNLLCLWRGGENKQDEWNSWPPFFPLHNLEKPPRLGILWWIVPVGATPK